MVLFHLKNHPLSRFGMSEYEGLARKEKAGFTFALEENENT